jgi:hypothetical protein
MAIVDRYNRWMGGLYYGCVGSAVGIDYVLLEISGDFDRDRQIPIHEIREIRVAMAALRVRLWLWRVLGDVIRCLFSQGRYLQEPSGVCRESGLGVLLALRPRADGC